MAPAIYGALAYTFCTFHAVWLLFPLGLTTMMLPLVLVGIDEVVTRHTSASLVPLIIGVTLTLLGGHPESAAWVLITAVMYAAYCLRTSALRGRTLGRVMTAIVLGIGSASVFWYPTWRLIPFTARGQLMEAMKKYPPAHEYSPEWFLPLLAPNVLGTPQTGTYRPPRPPNGGVLDDYGEIASAYAGVVSLGFALVALRRAYLRPRIFFIVAAAFASLAITESLGIHQILTHTPIIGFTLFGRLRFVLAFAIAMLAACGYSDILVGTVKRSFALGCLAVGLLITLTPYAMRAGTGQLRHVQIAHVIVATSSVLIASLSLAFGSRRTATGACCAGLLLDLLFVTYRYNPPARSQDMYPETGALTYLRQFASPWRVAAVGWSFLPETGSYYGIEDIKTTDPMADPAYLMIVGNVFRMRPADYDQIINDWTNPFINFLGIRFVYVPADQSAAIPGFKQVYAGSDGWIFENPYVFPRYFSASDVHIAPTIEAAIRKLGTLSDFRHSVTVDRVPDPVVRSIGAQGAEQVFVSESDVELVRYEPNATTLHVNGSSWNLVVSSDVAVPGWKATWNGKQLPVVTVNGAFLGTFVPGGSGTLRFTYRPPGLATGGAISAVSVIAIVLLLIFPRRTGLR